MSQYDIKVNVKTLKVSILQRKHKKIGDRKTNKGGRELLKLIITHAVIFQLYLLNTATRIIKMAALSFKVNQFTCHLAVCVIQAVHCICTTRICRIFTKARG